MTESYRPKHFILGDVGFDEAGHRIGVTWPQFADGAADPEETGAALAALDVIQRCLVAVIENGHKDGCLVRAAALGVMLGAYASPTAAAKVIDVEPSTVIRALDKLRTDVLCNKRPL